MKYSIKKKIILTILVFISGLIIYYNFYVYNKTKQLTTVAQKFSTDCNKNKICNFSPTDWEYNSPGVFLGKNLMIYKVSSDGKNFEIEQKIAISVSLKAQGGVNKEVTIEKIID